MSSCFVVCNMGTELALLSQLGASGLEPSIRPCGNHVIVFLVSRSHSDSAAFWSRIANNAQTRVTDQLVRWKVRRSMRLQ